MLEKGQILARQAIRNEGAKGEAEFSTVLGSRAKDSDNCASGDRQFLYQDEWHYIEIKQCESNTINQVRAIKCIPVVIFSPDKGSNRWCVLSPRTVIELVVDKPRGQHTEIPFECANLTRNSLPQHCWCSDEELEARLQAVVADTGIGKLKNIMDYLLNGVAKLREKYRREVKELLGSHNP